MIEYYLHPHAGWRYLLLCVSIFGTISSFFIPKAKQFQNRWVFGIAISTFFVFIGSNLTCYQESKSTFIFDTEETAYRVQIIDSPKEKGNSIFVSLYLPDHDRKISAYIQKTPLSEILRAGDGIYFYSKLDTFKTYQSATNFDYAKYMHNKGFAGSTYISAQRWDFNEEKATSLNVKALQTRSLILEFYKSLNLSDEEFGILSALTLGYKDSLSEETIDDFRTTGTAHLLAISGLHVGIIFFALSFLFSFIKNRKYQWIKYSIPLLVLWLYIFIIGLPASAVRAGIMISIFCIAQLLNRRRVAYNTLAISAFLMLLYNPLWLFNISFQFSFSATFFIIWLAPKADKLIKTRNRFLRFILNTFSISLIAQIGTFPLALFYFGYFPSYFFLSNLMIIPLAILLVYIGIVLTLCYPLFYLLGFDIFYKAISYIIKADIWLIQTTNSTIAKFPFSQITDISINNLSLILIYLFIFFSILGFVKKQSRPIVYTLVFFICLSINTWHLRLKNENKLSIYYGTDIRYNLHGKKFKIDPLNNMQFLNLKDTRILFLSENTLEGFVSENKLVLSCLILSGKTSYSLYELTQIFKIDKIVLDSSLPKQSVKKLAKECQELGISHHDVRENDAFHLFF